MKEKIPCPACHDERYTVIARGFKRLVVMAKCLVCGCLYTPAESAKVEREFVKQEEMDAEHGR